MARVTISPLKDGAWMTPYPADPGDVISDEQLMLGPVSSRFHSVGVDR